MSFAKECWPFVLPPAVAAMGLALLGLAGWAIAFLVIAGLMLAFFRIPRRPGAVDESIARSPADGKILRIDQLEDAEIGTGLFHRIVIFLSVFNVHVQRSPVTGRTVLCQYRDGRKLAAFDRRAGDVNEQQLTVVETADGDRIGIRQIAGLLARRVVTYLKPDQQVHQGELMGVIKFGSRVDLLLPITYDLQVDVGERVREGLTIVATASHEEVR